MGCLHDLANVQQTSSKCIQNARANAGRLLDRVNTLLQRRRQTDNTIGATVSTVGQKLVATRSFELGAAACCLQFYRISSTDRMG